MRTSEIFVTFVLGKMNLCTLHRKGKERGKEIKKMSKNAKGLGGH